jgi:hypothetical protein
MKTRAVMVMFAHPKKSYQAVILHQYQGPDIGKIAKYEPPKTKPPEGGLWQTIANNWDLTPINSGRSYPHPGDPCGLALPC